MMPRRKSGSDASSDKSGSDAGSTGSTSKLTRLMWALTKPTVMHGAPETLVDFGEVRVDFAMVNEEGEIEQGDLKANWATIDIVSKSNNADVAANPPRASPCLDYHVSLTDPRGSDLSLKVSMPDKDLPFCKGEAKVYIDLNVHGNITQYRNVIVRFNGDTIKEYNAPAKKCDMCKGDVVGEGHNPSPLEGNCVCDECNAKVVMPARAKSLKERIMFSKPDVDPRWATVKVAQEPEENENKLKPATEFKPEPKPTTEPEPEKDGEEGMQQCDFCKIKMNEEDLTGEPCNFCGKWVCCNCEGGWSREDIYKKHFLCEDCKGKTDSSK